MANIGELQAVISGDSSKLIEALDSAKSVLGSFGEVASAVAVGMGLEHAFEAITGAIIEMGKETLISSQDMEFMKMNLDNLTGSADASNTILSSLSDLSEKGIFDSKQLEQWTLKLVQMGYPQEKINTLMHDMANVTVGTSSSLSQAGDKMTSLATLFSNLDDKGNVSISMLTRFQKGLGIPILDAVAAQMKMTTVELTALGTKAGITPAILTAAFASLGEGQGKFADSVNKASNTMEARNLALSEQFDLVKKAVLGLTDSGDVIKGGFYDKLSTATGELIKLIPSFGDVIIWLGNKIFEIIKPAFDTFINLVKDLTKWFADHKTDVDNFGKGVTDFYNNNLKPLIDFITATAVKGFQELLTGIKNLTGWFVDHKKDVADFGSGISEFYNNHLKPLIDFIVGDAIKSFEDFAKQVKTGIQKAFEDFKPKIKPISDDIGIMIDDFKTLMEKLSPVTNWIRDVALKLFFQLAQLIGNIVVIAIKLITVLFHQLTVGFLEFANWAKTHQKTIQDLAVIIGIILAPALLQMAVSAGIATLAFLGQAAITGIMAVATGIASGAMFILNGAIWLVNGAMAVLTSPITLIVLAIGALIAIGIELARHWSDMANIISGTWGMITSVVKGAINMVIGGLDSMISSINTFLPSWMQIKPISLFTDNFDASLVKAQAGMAGFSAGVTNDVKQVTDGINSMVNGVKGGISGLFDTTTGIGATSTSTSDAQVKKIQDAIRYQQLYITEMNDLTKQLNQTSDSNQLQAIQARINEVQREYNASGVSSVINPGINTGISGSISNMSSSAQAYNYNATTNSPNVTQNNTFNVAEQANADNLASQLSFQLEHYGAF